MGHKATGIPVYLVNPDQMDALYPPKRLQFLNPRCVRRWAEEVRRREAGIREESREVGEGEARREGRPSPWECLDEEMTYRYRWVVAVGLYVSDFGTKELQTIRVSGSSPAGAGPTGGPAIVLSPERIVGWAQRAGVSPDLVLDKVYYHELGHALMDTGPTPYEEPWARVVEESLANWIAYRSFHGLEAVQVQRLMQEQPLEYRGYAVLEDPDFARDLSKAVGCRWRLRPLDLEGGVPLSVLSEWRGAKKGPPGL